MLSWEAVNFPNYYEDSGRDEASALPLIRISKPNIRIHPRKQEIGKLAEVITRMSSAVSIGLLGWLLILPQSVDSV